MTEPTGNVGAEGLGGRGKHGMPGRNGDIYRRLLAGERAVDLAREFNVGVTRIYKICEAQRDRQARGRS